MIPKIIHYCWFGRNPKSELLKKCIKSWKRKCRGYKVIEWNEDNFDISSAPLYVRQAYSQKKWAFVSDYARLKIIYENGGIYLDTDVELLKSLDDFLSYKAFFGMEYDSYINTGLGFGAEKGTEILLELMEQYKDIPFILENGEYDETVCPLRNTEIFIRHGLKEDGSKQILDGNILILSKFYLCPIIYKERKLRLTEETYSIHWFESSWISEEIRPEFFKKIKAEKRDYIIHIPNRILMKLLGDKLYQKIKFKFKK